ncbi:uncharacterized protein LOC123498767 [Portunus trituberculatus]|uniref:uncharacterized protein LOC123498767 n=1 Tax=Portunus trituberculatus TaxID=210409 RepID=UPI001E1CEFCF|nr:uncharacterized protein LOC123498767 [Portunus trituberculatus]
MRSLVIVSVVLGVAFGAQVFPRDTPEVEAARNAFIAEYNRLARLAALAPDIHIYHRDRVMDPVTNVPQAINPPTFNAFSFSANLGTNEHFVPGPNIFPGATHMAGHLAGHQAAPTHKPVLKHAPRPMVTAAPHRFTAVSQTPLFDLAAEEPIMRWTGPFADEVPAGLSGHVSETPSVVAAKAAHFRAHADYWNQANRNTATQR